MKLNLIILVFFISCSQAGVLPNPDITLPVHNPSSTLEVIGVVGLGAPLTNASISIIKMTDPSSPVVLATAESDDTGHFTVTIDDVVANDEILFVASGGTYIDPLSFQTVTNQNDFLEGIWRRNQIANLETINITPLSTLATAFYSCLSNNTALAADPLDYSIATFNTVFGVNLNVDQDVFLTESTTDSDALYSLYNLAFARMTKEKHAASALALVSAFVSHLEENCDLLGPAGFTSGSYAFFEESFRRDFLDAFANLRLEASLSTLIGNTDLSSIAEDIRASSNILFQFEEYDL